MDKVFRITSGDPNGKIMAQAPAICYGKDGCLWVKTNDTYDDQGWIAFIAASDP